MIPSAGIHAWVSRNCIAWVVVSKPTSIRTVRAKSASVDDQRRPSHPGVVAEEQDDQRPGGGQEHDEAQERQVHRAAYRQATTKIAMAAITPAIIATA